MSKATKNNETVVNHPYISTDTFLESAKPVYEFSAIQATAFKVSMKSIGKYYLPTLNDFVPYFENYLGLDKKEGK